MHKVSPETQTFINDLLSSGFNRDRVYPILVGYVIAMKTEVTDLPKLVNDTSLDIRSTLDAMSELTPFDVVGAKDSITAFMSWRRAVCKGTINIMSNNVSALNLMGSYLSKNDEQAIISATKVANIARAISHISNIYDAITGDD